MDSEAAPNQGTQVSLLVTIEGNLGAGKSTFLTKFQENEEYITLGEPVRMWESVGQENLLELKYRNPNRWEFTFQIYADLTRALSLRDTQCQRKVRIQERSMLSGHKIFAALQQEAGCLSEMEAEVLKTWYDYLSGVGSGVQTTPDLFIYLRAPPEVVFERMRNRNRVAEQGVSLTYLQKVHDYHEQLFITNASQLPSPVLVLDTSLDESSFPHLWAEAEASIQAARCRKVREQELVDRFMEELIGETQG
jgi:deoxyadenosine/deoxycytidine kinase